MREEHTELSHTIFFDDLIGSPPGTPLAKPVLSKIYDTIASPIVGVCTPSIKD